MIMSGDRSDGQDACRVSFLIAEGDPNMDFYSGDTLLGRDPYHAATIHGCNARIDNPLGGL
jgi:hypothetical protein